jgi:predicted TPR repeat methyltransferase
MSQLSFASYTEHVAAAAAAHKANDLVAAADLYRSLAEEYPGKKSAAVQAANGLQACGHWTDAVSVLIKALERHPDAPTIVSNLSRACSEVGDFSRAAQYLRSFLDRDPRDTSQWLQLGDLYFQAGDLEDAAFSYGKILSAEPLNIEAALRRGDALKDLGRFDEAMADYRRAETIQPDNPQVLFKLGAIALATENPRDAVDRLNRAVAGDPQNAMARATLSLALSSLGLYEDAARAAEASLTIEADFAFGRFALGSALLGLERFSDAAAVLKLAAEAASTSPDVLTALAEAETGQENFFAAERALLQVLSVDPENKRARFMIAALHGEAVDSPPPGFAADTFDRVAQRYDHTSSSIHGYDAPVAAAMLLEDTLPDRDSFLNVADLGCGTGLVLAALRDAFRVDAATGIDSSPKMIDLAAQKNLYDRLIVDEALRVMAASKEQFDLITAIELAPYLGNLSSLMTAIPDRLTPDGLFLCSIERADAVRYELRRGGRFAHGAAYLEETARAAGLVAVAHRDIALHRTGGRQTEGRLTLFRRG